MMVLLLFSGMKSPSFNMIERCIVKVVNIEILFQFNLNYLTKVRDLSMDISFPMIRKAVCWKVNYLASTVEKILFEIIQVESPFIVLLLVRFNLCKSCFSNNGELSLLRSRGHSTGICYPH